MFQRRKIDNPRNRFYNSDFSKNIEQMKKFIHLLKKIHVFICLYRFAVHKNRDLTPKSPVGHIGLYRVVFWGFEFLFVLASPFSCTQYILVLSLNQF